MSLVPKWVKRLFLALQIRSMQPRQHSSSAETMLHLHLSKAGYVHFSDHIYKNDTKQLHNDLCLWYPSQPNIKVAYGEKQTADGPAAAVHIWHMAVQFHVCQLTRWLFLERIPTRKIHLSPFSHRLNVLPTLLTLIYTSQKQLWNLSSYDRKTYTYMVLWFYNPCN